MQRPPEPTVPAGQGREGRICRQTGGTPVMPGGQKRAGERSTRMVRQLGGAPTMPDGQTRAERQFGNVPTVPLGQVWPERTWQSG